MSHTHSPGKGTAAHGKGVITEYNAFIFPKYVHGYPCFQMASRSGPWNTWPNCWRKMENIYLRMQGQHCYKGSYENRLFRSICSVSQRVRQNRPFGPEHTPQSVSGMLIRTNQEHKVSLAFDTMETPDLWQFFQHYIRQCERTQWSGQVFCQFLLVFLGMLNLGRIK